MQQFKRGAAENAIYKIAGFLGVVSIIIGTLLAIFGLIVLFIGFAAGNSGANDGNSVAAVFILESLAPLIGGILWIAAGAYFISIRNNMLEDVEYYDQQ